MKNELQKLPLRIGTFEAQSWAVEIAQRPAPVHRDRGHDRKPGSVTARHHNSTHCSR